MVPIKNGSFLIIGGASLIGSHIAEQLVEGGAARVVIFDNFSLGTPENVHHLADNPKVEIKKGDVTRLPETVNAMEGIGGVFLVAGLLTTPLAADVWAGVDVNVKGLQNTLDAARWKGVGKVVFSSSVGVYAGTATDRYDECTPLTITQTNPASAIYGASKALGEALCRFYDQNFGLPSVFLRYCSVYGERLHRRSLNAPFILDVYAKVRRGEAPVIPGDGSEVHDYVHVADCARANLMAMESAVSGEAFNISSELETSTTELVQHILTAMKSDLVPVHGQDARAITFTTSRHLNYVRGKARDMLGWEPRIGVAEGIARMVAYLDETGGEGPA